MAKEKKSAKAGRSSGSKSAIAYVANGRRYFNKIRRVKQHIKRTHDGNARDFLKGLQSILAMDYIRGSEAVRDLHERHFGGH